MTQRLRYSKQELAEIAKIVPLTGKAQVDAINNLVVKFKGNKRNYDGIYQKVHHLRTTANKSGKKVIKTKDLITKVNTSSLKMDTSEVRISFKSMRIENNELILTY